MHCPEARPAPCLIHYPPLSSRTSCPPHCLQVYQNEEEVGEALGQVLEQGLVPRSQLYIVSKVW